MTFMMRNPPIRVGFIFPLPIQMRQLIIHPLQIRRHTLQKMHILIIRVRLSIQHHRLLQTLASPCQTRVILITLSLPQSTCHLPTRLPLQLQQTQCPKNQIRMLQLFRHRLILHITRTGTFMNILRHKIMPQHPTGARMPVLPPHPIKQSATTHIKHRNHLIISHRQINLTLLQPSHLIRVKKTRFRVQIRPQRHISIRHTLLHRSMRKQHMNQQRIHTIQHRPTQNHRRIHIPHHVRLISQRGIYRHRQRTKRNRPIAQTNRPAHRKNKRQHRYRSNKPPSIAQSKLHRQRRHRKRQQHKKQILQPPR